MKKKLSVYLFIIMSFFLFSDNVVTEYGHVSLVKSNSPVIVKRLNGERDKAIVNLPIVPGDTIITNEKSRCEIQFNNGTIIRLDNNTRLKIVTILAKALTTKKKITTLELLKGSAYIMSQVYNKEIFQVTTENSASLFKKSTTAILQYNDEETNLNVYRGSIEVMYGKDIKSIKKEKIKSKKFFTITPDNDFIKSEKIYNEKFLTWNKEINKDFDKLHKGINKVPKPIYRYSKGIIHWAEKWSTMYGEWVYDDIFGYIWKPYDESFKYNHRPFFFAEFVTINNKLYCVPTQKWGWAPSQLGTWIFVKSSGWRWIPGNAFSGGIFHNSAQYSSSSLYLYGISNYNNLNFWINGYYGGYDLYYIYRNRGRRIWEKEYQKIYKKPVKKLSLPAHIKKLITKLNKADLSKINRTISKSSKIKKSELKYKYIKKLPTLESSKHNTQLNASKGFKISRINTDKMKTEKYKKEKSARNAIMHIKYRDFNPDRKLAIKSNIKIRYSSKTNSVVFKNKLMNKRYLIQKLKRQKRMYNRNRTNKYYKGSNSSGTQGTKTSLKSVTSQRAKGKTKDK